MALGSPWKRWMEWTGRGKSGPLHDPAPDKGRREDEVGRGPDVGGEGARVR